MNHRHWKVLPSAADERLASIVGLPPIVVQLLHNRGVTEPAQVEPFLTADKQLCGDPFLLLMAAGFDGWARQPEEKKIWSHPGKIHRIDTWQSMQLDY